MEWMTLIPKRKSPISKGLFQSLLLGTTLAIPNLLFSITAHQLQLGRGLINLDYALAIALLTLNKNLGALSIILFIITDATSLIGQVIPFVRLSDLLYLVTSSFHTSSFYLTLVIVTTLLLTLKIFIIYKTFPHISSLGAWILLNICLLTFLLQPQQGLTSEDRFYRANTGELVSSQTLTTYRLRMHAFLDNFNESGEPFSTYHSSSAVSEALKLEAPSERKSNPHKLLLIVAESWGVPHLPQVQDAILGPLYSLPSRKIRTGRFKFTGVTLAGELRELCKLHPHHFNLRHVKDGFTDCLPQQLKALGYETTAMHGSSGSMYDRRHWYPRAGFDNTVFFESRIWPQRCFSFPGACDLDLLGEVESFFLKPGPQFLYWLTLNSHTPYDRRDIRFTLVDCEALKINPNSEPCRNILLHAQLFANLANLLEKESMKDIELILVGDHPPVILNQEEKHSVFVHNQVPWLHLERD